jgi:hypothetical protein
MTGTLAATPVSLPFADTARGVVTVKCIHGTIERLDAPVSLVDGEWRFGDVSPECNVYMWVLYEVIVPFDDAMSRGDRALVAAIQQNPVEKLQAFWERGVSVCWGTEPVDAASQIMADQEAAFNGSPRN